MSPLIPDAKASAAEPAPARPSTPSRIYWLAVTLSVGFLCLLLGFVTTVLQVFPYNLFRQALLAVENDSARQLDLFTTLTPTEIKSYQSGVTR